MDVTWVMKKFRAGMAEAALPVTGMMTAHTTMPAMAAMTLLAALPIASAAGPVEDLDAWLKLDRAARPAMEAQAFASQPLTAADCARAKALIWAERLAFVKAQDNAQWTAKQLVDSAGFQMPFDYRIYGSKPAAGYDLYISMHGGGDGPASVNDQQWQNQIILYHPPGIYLAPRAPTDAWNMWHKDHIDAFFDRIIQLCVANLGANANRVYLMGYSAGGDGVYQMAPRMADRWAGACMMAGYPNQSSPINLRNTAMTLDVGALDSAYHRNAMLTQYAQQMQQLQDLNPGAYIYSAHLHSGKPHWMDLEDTVSVALIAHYTRHPNSPRLAWHQDTTVVNNSFPSGPITYVHGKATQYQFYWLSLRAQNPAAKPALIYAQIRGQEVHIDSSNIDSLAVLLNDSLLNLDAPVSVYWGGALIYAGQPARTAANLYRSVNARGDADYAFPARLNLAKTDRPSGSGIGRPARPGSSGPAAYREGRGAGAASGSGWSSLEVTSAGKGPRWDFYRTGQAGAGPASDARGRAQNAVAP